MPASDMVDGPRKRRPTEHVTENGDPLVQKKAKTVKTVSTNTKITSSITTLSRRASIEDVVDPTPAPGSQPRHPDRILEAADGADDHDDTFGMPNLIDIEDSDDEEEEEGKEDEDSEPEDDDAELGMDSSYIC